MKLSLIVPCYNEEKRIYACLDAVMRSGYPFHQIIVVDNGSTDMTVEIVQRFFPQAEVVSEPKVGLSHARQRGFWEATGDVLVYIDADTRMPRGWTERVAAEMADSTTAAVSGPCSYYDAPRWQQWAVKWIWWRTVSRLTYWVTGTMLMGSGFAIRRWVVASMGGFPIVDFYGEDTAIAAKADEFGRCLFLFDLEMPASARRLKQQGLLHTVLTYAWNYVRPGATKAHVDYR